VIRVVVFRPGQRPSVEEIDGDLESLQRLVGGYLELIALGGGLHMYCNEDARSLGLPQCCYVASVTDVVRGTAIVYGMDVDGETERSLTDAEIETVLKLVRPAFIQQGGAA
jgi:hypothetical protein